MNHRIRQTGWVYLATVITSSKVFFGVLKHTKRRKMSQVLTMKDGKKKEKEAPQAIAKRPSAVLEEVPIVDVRILNKARKIEGLPPVGEGFK